MLDEHIEHFRRSGEKRTFFICHFPQRHLSVADSPGVHLWTGDALAAITIKSGLFDWLVERVG